MRGFILASVGYQVLIPDAIYHGERNPLLNYDVENAAKLFWKIILNNIEESYILIDGLVSKYDADVDRIGVIGHSMGGFTAAGAFTHNPYIKALVVLNGSCYWENSNNIFHEKLKIEMNNRSNKLAERISSLDPMKNLDLLVDRPILLLHGEKDSVVSIESQRIFYDKIKNLYANKDRIKFVGYPNLDHFVTTNMMEEAIYWFYLHL